LGFQTHDVDIALDTCTGVEFATLLKHRVEAQQQQQQQQQQIITVVTAKGGVWAHRCHCRQSRTIKTVGDGYHENIWH
jgi:hypothetical protein